MRIPVRKYQHAVLFAVPSSLRPPQCPCMHCCTLYNPASRAHMPRGTKPPQRTDPKTPRTAPGRSHASQCPPCPTTAAPLAFPIHVPTQHGLPHRNPTTPPLPPLLQLPPISCRAAASPLLRRQRRRQQRPRDATNAAVAPAAAAHTASAASRCCRLRRNTPAALQQPPPHNPQAYSPSLHIPHPCLRSFPPHALCCCWPFTARTPAPAPGPPRCPPRPQCRWRSAPGSP